MGAEQMRIGPDEREYHVERARAELDAGYRATGSQAAASHLQLCSLHMARARLRQGTEGFDAPPELRWLDACSALHERALSPRG